MALPPPTETFRSLTHANQLRNNRGVGQVQFLLDEETPLVDAAIIKTRTRPGLLGFRMLNPELMDCKHRTKVELEEAYNEMFQDCMHRCDHELVTVDASIAELRRLINLPDGEIPHNGPPIGQRNQGLREVIYLRPPFEDPPEYKYNPNPQVAYQPACASPNDRAQALSRDRRAQRAWWQINLDLLEVRKKIVEEKKVELERKLRTELRRAMESPSVLGAGYTNYTFLH